MKRNHFFPGLVVMFLLATAALGCSNDDNGNSAPGITDAQVRTAITDGLWRVTLYDEGGVIQTSDYSGYSFDFNADGSMTATNGSSNKTGTWNSGPDSGSIKLTITFTDSDGPFESISEDWRVLTSTSSKIELKHVSGGDGSTDLLTFEKI